MTNLTIHYSEPLNIGRNGEVRVVIEINCDAPLRGREAFKCLLPVFQQKMVELYSYLPIQVAKHISSSHELFLVDPRAASIVTETFKARIFDASTESLSIIAANCTEEECNPQFLNYAEKALKIPKDDYSFSQAYQ